ncbi:MAG: ABC transporter ATP-binding protein, partial [Ignavibacteriae bacterium]|nr:ABC transporter ATP-binding protein [Ignavibacteriota bacterium]
MIEISNLTKKYENGKTALDDISFKINPGEICGYIGTNGAGKTTTIKIISGVIEFDSGSVIVSNLDVKQKPVEVKKIIGYVPESGNIFNSLTTTEYLFFIGRIRNIEENIIKKRIEYFAELFDYTGFINTSIGSLSKGTKQKILSTS